MKKCTSMFLCLVLVLSLLCVNAAAAGTAAEVRAELNENGTVTLVVTASEAAANAKLNVTFDSNCLTYMGYETAFAVHAAKAEEEAVTVSLANATADAAQAGGELVKLSFAVTGGWDETQLTVTTARLNGVDCGEAVTVTVAGTGYRFADVRADDWFYDAVENLVAAGAIQGVSETHFGPGLEMNRAMFVTVLGRLAGVADAKVETRFTDVPVDSFYSGFVAWADGSGIVKGVSETLFAPENSVTREQMVTFLYRYVQSTGADVTVENAETVLASFADAADVSSWALDAMVWAVDRGIILGTDLGLQPQAVTNRAQAVVMLSRFFFGS